VVRLWNVFEKMLPLSDGKRVGGDRWARLWEQAQVTGPLVKELAEPLDIIGTGKCGSSFPTSNHQVMRSANALSHDPLRPSSLQACPA
jgi:hypothetical protein